MSTEAYQTLLSLYSQAEQVGKLRSKAFEEMQRTNEIATEKQRVESLQVEESSAELEEQFSSSLVFENEWKRVRESLLAKINLLNIESDLTKDKPQPEELEGVQKEVSRLSTVSFERLLSDPRERSQGPLPPRGALPPNANLPSPGPAQEPFLPPGFVIPPPQTTTIVLPTRPPDVPQKVGVKKPPPVRAKLAPAGVNTN